MLCFTLAGTGLRAEPLPSLLTVEGGGDSEGSSDSYLSLDYGLPAGARLLVSLAGNRNDSQYNAITTHTTRVGVSSNPLDKLSAGVELEHWGQEDVLVTDTLRIVMESSLDNWLFSLRPEWATLTLTTDCIALIIANCKPEEKVHSSGVAIDINYFTDGPWGFSIGYASHSYDRHIEALDKYPVFQLVFSAATLDLAAGVEDSRSRVGVSYATTHSLWGLSHLRSVAKVGGSESLVTTLRFSTDITKQWRLRLRAGNQHYADNSADRVGFAGAGLSYSW